VPKKVWLFRSPNKKAGNHLQKPQKPSRGDLQNIPKWESDQSLANLTLRMLIREEILDHLENIDSIDLGARWNFFQ